MQNYNEKFKDRDIKIRAYKYALAVIRLIDKLARESTCQVMGRQLLRSATSIGANIMEAQASSSRREFTNFINHALKSANESKFWIGLLKDSGRAQHDDIAEIYQETRELSNILGASLLTLRGKRKF
jgi:four helix bundle protein